MDHGTHARQKDDLLLGVKDLHHVNDTVLLQHQRVVVDHGRDVDPLALVAARLVLLGLERRHVEHHEHLVHGLIQQSDE